MPSDTFYRLLPEKRNRILQAAKEEFSQVAFSEASINKIVKNAGISRGSFYMYFHDKYDLLRVLLEDITLQLRNCLFEEAKKSDGMLDALMLGVHDFFYHAYQVKENRNFLQNLLTHASMNPEAGMELFPKDLPYIRLFQGLIPLLDTRQFEITSPDAILVVVELAFSSLKNALHRAISGEWPIEQSRMNYQKHIHIIKLGYLRRGESSC